MFNAKTRRAKGAGEQREFSAVNRTRGWLKPRLHMLRVFDHGLRMGDLAEVLFFL